MAKKDDFIVKNREKNGRGNRHGATVKNLIFNEKITSIKSFCNFAEEIYINRRFYPRNC